MTPQRAAFNREMRELYRLSRTVEDDNADVLARGLAPVGRDYRREALERKWR